ncbi:MAG TPA: hypothetical protein VHU40_04175 [Polyangia bacterium]|nr:hypothetical protein [Polyangia bacterium]
MASTEAEPSDQAPPAPPAAGELGAWPRWFWPLFGAGLVACLLPLAMSPVLPMCDLNGAAGIVGALLQRSNPDSHIRDYYSFHVHASPNALYWAVTFALAKLVPVAAANNLFVGLFCVAGMPLCYLFALRSLGRHPALAFLALAAVYHRCLWYGFAGSVAAVGLLFLQLGLMNHAFTRRRWSRWDAALAATLLVLATAHAFLFLVGLGLWLLFVALATRQPSPVYRRVVVALPALAYLGPWLRQVLSGSPAGLSVRETLRHLWERRPPTLSYVTDVHQWFLNAYTSHVDEGVALIFGVTLLAALALGVRPLRAVPAPAPKPDPLWESRVPLTAVFLALGYFLLPVSIDVPLGWWAVNVRLLVPCLLTLGLLVRPRTRGLPGWALWPVWLAATGYGLFIAQDFRRWWSRVELDGFQASLEAIPPGQRVHALYPVFTNERHYSHFPMAHIVDWYIIARGGAATPAMTSHPKELWAAPRPWPQAPWGVHRAFSWERHGVYWDYFLVKQPAPGNGRPYDPFPDAPGDAVTPVFQQGLWSVWKRTQPTSIPMPVPLAPFESLPR